MLNKKIIDEFTKLVNSIQMDIDNNTSDLKKTKADGFRLRQNKIVLGILKKYPDVITIDNVASLGELSGIGKGTITRLVEILTEGSLKELENFKDVNQKKRDIIEELESIIGVGPMIALELYNMGVVSIKDLKKKIKSGEISVNEKIELGIKYYGKFEGNIPRNEIDKMYVLFENIIKDINKKNKLNEYNKYIFEICGSYRRGKPTSNDIDVLITKVDITSDSMESKTNHLEMIVNKLKENLSMNNKKPLLVHDITDKNFETKYMGFAKYKNNPFRRIDIRFIPYDSFHSALLYFTGSAELNKMMRKTAKKMGYKLSEYGLFNIKDNSKVDIKSEYDVFKFLKLQYLEPTSRSIE